MGGGPEPKVTPPTERSESWHVLKTGAWYTIAGAAPAITGLAVLPFLTRTLPIEAFGQAALAMVTIPLLSLLLGLGLPAAITRQSIIESAGFDGARGLHVQALALVGAFTIVLSTLAFAVPAPALADLYGGRTGTALTIVASGFAAIVGAAQANFRAADRVSPFVISALVAGPIGAALGLVIALAGSATAPSFLLGVTTGYAVAAVGSSWIVLREGAIVRSWQGLSAALRIGGPTIPHSLALGLAAGGLVLVAGSTGSLELAAEARIVLAVATGAGLLVTSLNNAWAPTVYRTQTSDLDVVLHETSRTMGWIAALSGGLIAVTSPWIVQILAPPEYDYEAMASAISIAAVGPLLQVAYLSSVMLVLLGGRTYPLAISTPLAVGLGIIAAIALIRSLGLQGIGLAYVATFSGLSVLTYIVSSAVAPVRWRASAIIRPAAVLVVVVVLCLVPLQPIPSDSVRVTTAVALLAVALVSVIRLRRHQQPRHDRATSSRVEPFANVFDAEVGQQ